MTERNLQSLFGEWLKKNSPTESAVYELKLEKGSSIAFSKVQKHQEVNLVLAATNGFFHKIADAPFGHSSGFRFHRKKEFDCLFIAKPKAYVVICFYKPRHKKRVMFIDIREWLYERDVTSKRKSLSEKRAAEISSKIVMI